MSTKGHTFSRIHVKKSNKIPYFLFNFSDSMNYSNVTPVDVPLLMRMCSGKFFERKSTANWRTEAKLDRSSSITSTGNM